MKGLADLLKKSEEESGPRDENKFGMLRQLNMGYNQYAGTADPEKVRCARAKNKVGAKTRRNNRKKK